MPFNLSCSYHVESELQFSVPTYLFILAALRQWLGVRSTATKPASWSDLTFSCLTLQLSSYHYQRRWRDRNWQSQEQKTRKRLWRIKFCQPKSGDHYPKDVAFDFLDNSFQHSIFQPVILGGGGLFFFFFFFRLVHLPGLNHYHRPFLSPSFPKTLVWP